jgi:two-component system, NarL family, response regulator NreC
MKQPVRILIADDHPAIRTAVRHILREHPRFEVCGEAEDGARAIEEAQKLEPDVIVLDVTVPVLNGFEAAREIKEKLPTHNGHHEKEILFKGAYSGGKGR